MDQWKLPFLVTANRKPVRKIYWRSGFQRILCANLHILDSNISGSLVFRILIGVEWSALRIPGPQIWASFIPRASDRIPNWNPVLSTVSQRETPFYCTVNVKLKKFTVLRLTAHILNSPTFSWDCPFKGELCTANSTSLSRKMRLIHIMLPFTLVTHSTGFLVHYPLFFFTRWANTVSESLVTET
jgi:hypothetical protein